MWEFSQALSRPSHKTNGKLIQNDGDLGVSLILLITYVVYQIKPSLRVFLIWTTYIQKTKKKVKKIKRIKESSKVVHRWIKCLHT